MIEGYAVVLNVITAELTAERKCGIDRGEHKGIRRVCRAFFQLSRRLAKVGDRLLTLAVVTAEIGIDLGSPKAQIIAVGQGR